MRKRKRGMDSRKLWVGSSHRPQLTQLKLEHFHDRNWENSQILQLT